jgi:transcriptional/translational regulatory protein YebC/TACO1
MAGHSKWAKVKRIKAVLDVRRGKVFCRISREITISAKFCGGDPAMNPRLRTPVLKARDANMAADNIDRAIKTESSEIAYIPTIPVPVADARTAKPIVRFHEALEELDDVQQVFSNEEMDESVSGAAHA